jgi:hypothetical protein
VVTGESWQKLQVFFAILRLWIVLVFEKNEFFGFGEFLLGKLEIGLWVFIVPKKVGVGQVWFGNLVRSFLFFIVLRKIGLIYSGWKFHGIGSIRIHFRQ